MKKNSRFLVLLIILCFFYSPAFSEGSAHEMSFCNLSFHLEAHFASGTKKAGLYVSPALENKPEAHIEPTSSITLLGIENKSWHVQADESSGYVSKSKISFVGIPDGNAPVSNSVLSSTLKTSATMVRPRDEDYILLEGSQELSEAVDFIGFFLWDEWQKQVERTWLFAPDSPTAKLDAETFARVMPTKNLNAGRKMLCIQGFISGRSVVLARLPFFVAGKVANPVSLNHLCTFVPNDHRLLDSNPETCWSPSEKRKELTVSLPKDTPASLIQMEWYKPPEKTEIIVSSADGTELLNETLETGFLVDSVSLPANAVTVVIRPYGKRLRMSSVRVYADDYPRELVQQWKPMPEKLDMLLFSTHQDDEILFFSGLTPWYSHLGKEIGIVYMSNCGRARYREALDGIWLSGIRIHPVLLGYPDKDIASMDVARNLWPEAQEAVVRELRRCKPDVVVVQDQNGEYGHTQHKLTSELVCKGVELAADASFDPESAAEYGVWDVKKLYVHLYEKDQVHMDWNIPLPECGGFTPWDISVAAFEMHHSQYGYFRMERQSIEYDSSLFGLYRSTVGPDSIGNDMFENLE